MRLSAADWIREKCVVFPETFGYNNNGIRIFSAEENKSLLSSCRPLEEYAWLVAQIRENQRFMGIEDAAEKAARYAGMTEEQFLSYRK